MSRRRSQSVPKVAVRPSKFFGRPGRTIDHTEQTDRPILDEADRRDVGIVVRNIFWSLISNSTYRRLPRTQVLKIQMFVHCDKRSEHMT